MKIIWASLKKSWKPLGVSRSHLESLWPSLSATSSISWIKDHGKKWSQLVTHTDIESGRGESVPQLCHLEISCEYHISLSLLASEMGIMSFIPLGHCQHKTGITLLWYSLYCDGLKPNPLCLWGVFVLVEWVNDFKVTKCIHTVISTFYPGTYNILGQRCPDSTFKMNLL